jgi:hypothetical protein
MKGGFPHMHTPLHAVLETFDHALHPERITSINVVAPTIEIAWPIEHHPRPMAISPASFAIRCGSTVI